MAFCQKCGSPATGNFCEKCGATIVAPRPPAQQPAQPQYGPPAPVPAAAPSKNLLPVIVAVVVVVVVIVVVLAVVLLALSPGGATGDTEPNDSFATANVIRGGETVYGHLDEYGDPEDFYKISLSTGDAIGIELSGPFDADFDMCFYSPGHSELDCSTGGDSDEYIYDFIISSGTYYINVYCFSDSGSYTLAVSVY